MPVRNAVSLNGSRNTICFTWSALEMSPFASWLYKRGIFFVSCIQCFCGKRRLFRCLEERNINQVIRAWNWLFCFRALRRRHISRILDFIFLCKAYFCFKGWRTRFEVIRAWRTRYLSSPSRLLWAVPLHGFKIDAYLAIYHACCICLRKAPYGLCWH